MPLFVWNNRFALGQQLLDEQHQHLFDLFNKAYETFLAYDNKITIDALLAELANYTVYHFAAEEKLMRSTNFPGFLEHKQEHERFISRVEELKKGYRERHQNTHEIIAFLCNWLLDHIMCVDKKICNHLAASSN